MFYVNIDGVDYPSNNLPPSSNNKATIERRERRKRSKLNRDYCIDFDCKGCDLERSPKLEAAMTYASGYSMSGAIEASPIYLAPLPVAVPSPKITGCKAGWIVYDDVIKEEGKTPMSYNAYNDNYACATVSTPVSDTAVQRDYLLTRLTKADYPKGQELVKLFNVYVDNTPKTYKELIDAIKNDKFSIDKKVEKRLELLESGDDDEYGFSHTPLHGIIWAGPQPDHDGFSAATLEKNKQLRAAKDVIMSGVYADGLKALQDFEAWLPVGKSN